MDELIKEVTKRYYSDQKFRSAIEYGVMSATHKIRVPTFEIMEEVKEGLRISAGVAIICFEKGA